MVSTEEGDLVLFQPLSLEDFSKPLGKGEKCAVKYVKVNGAAITHLSVHEDLIIVGTEDGAVKVFDKQVRILFWYSKISGAVTTILTNPFGDSKI